jgi:hypothetical protein
MKPDKIAEIAETYINGNISDAKAALRAMSKRDVNKFILELAQYMDLYEAVTTTERLLP